MQILKSIIIASVSCRNLKERLSLFSVYYYNYACSTIIIDNSDLIAINSFQTQRYR